MFLRCIFHTTFHFISPSSDMVILTFTALGCRNPACRMGALWICTGCRLPIRDPVVLRVGSHQLWHTGCLCCAECHCPLQDDASCFLRDGQPFCRGDYSRKFAVRCGGCRVALCPTDLVLRAGGSIYHPTCLRCSLCNRLLMPGDCFTAGLRGLCCQAEQPTADSRIDRGGLSLEPSAGERAQVFPSHTGERGQRGGVRVRTVISDGQLSLLLSCYSRTPRPDAQAKLQLGHLTGLSPRVIRVWFQNKRCKDRRRLRGQDSSLGGSRSRVRE
ncbi:insulin gene enhancer protein ISL-2B-like [Arapaima gigas]